ncbi:MAG: nucleotidyltransferase domain-containing protein [Nanoarchaeota archaeon]
MLKSYSSYFSSYLLYNLKGLDNIIRIILFGSVAKEENNKESDVDIFIEIKKKSKIFVDRIEKITEDFYKSREALIFKSNGVDNKINVIVGKLEEWDDLKKSIDSTGIVLYGRYVSSGFKAGGKKYSLFFWNKIGKNRGAFLNKIYGFNSKGKKYKGFFEIFGGKKLGKSSIMVPIEHKNEILKLLKHYQVSAKIIEVYV